MVAIKELLPSDSREGEGVGTNLAREAAALAAFQHPNVVSVHDLVVHNGEPWVIMEFINGETLEQAMRRGALAFLDFQKVAVECLLAMQAAHGLGIHHRDLKPSNVMVQWLPNGEFLTKVLDFGLAEYQHHPPQRQEMDHVYGSVYFLAPEQFLNEPTDERTDLYSLGCLLFYCLTAAYPFRGKTVRDTIDAHLGGQVAPLLHYRQDLPPGMADFILKCMARLPADRFSSATQALAEFRRLTNLAGAEPASPAAVAAKPRWESLFGPRRERISTTHTTRLHSITQRLSIFRHRKALLAGAGAAAALLAGILLYLPQKGGANARKAVSAPPIINWQPPSENLAIWLDAPRGRHAGFGSSATALDEPFGVWEDLCTARGRNHAQAVLPGGNGGTSLSAHPIAVLNEGTLGLARQTTVIRFAETCLTLATLPDNAAPALPLDDSRAIFGAPGLTCALLIRIRSDNPGVVLSAMHPDKFLLWQISAEDGSFHLGRGLDSSPSATVANPGPDSFCILTVSLNGTNGEGRLCVIDRNGKRSESLSPAKVLQGREVQAVRMGAGFGTGREAESYQNFLDADIAEVLIYPQLLSSMELAAVQNYLSVRHFVSTASAR